MLVVAAGARIAHGDWQITDALVPAIMLVAFAWLWKRRAHTHGVGWLFGCYLIWAGVERFLVEFIRAKDDRIFGQFSLAQLTSVLLFVLGLWLVRKWRAPDPLTATVPDSLRPRAAAPTSG